MESAQTWRTNNRERVRTTVKHYRETHKEQIAKKNREWCDTHQAHCAKRQQRYVETHRPQVNNHARQRRARKRAALHTEPINQDIVYKRDKGICSLCHKHVAKKDMSLDHVIPLTKGGDDTYQNIALAHLLCNIRKQNRVVVQQMRLFG
jgi:5-methylcytosine-specific restriction endonuclease McrA